MSSAQTKREQAWTAAGGNVFTSKWVFKKPLRPFRIAMRYWWPRRLTMAHNPRVHAWLWWNF